MQAGSIEPRQDWIGLDEVVGAADESLSAPPAGFDIRIDPDLPPLNADAAQLERAIANVLENAGRYAGDQPVAVRGRTAGPAYPDRTSSVSSSPSTAPVRATARAPDWDSRSLAASWRPTAAGSGPSRCPVRARAS